MRKQPLKKQKKLSEREKAINDTVAASTAYASSRRSSLPVQPPSTSTSSTLRSSSTSSSSHKGDTLGRLGSGLGVGRSDGLSSVAVGRTNASPSHPARQRQGQGLGQGGQGLGQDRNNHNNNHNRQQDQNKQGQGRQGQHQAEDGDQDDVLSMKSTNEVIEISQEAEKRAEASGTPTIAIIHPSISSKNM